MNYKKLMQLNLPNSILKSRKKKFDYKVQLGTPPETLIYTGEREPVEAEIEAIRYDQESASRIVTRDVSEVRRTMDEQHIHLIIVNNLTDINLIEKIGEAFNIEKLVLEDVLNASHPPKLEQTNGYIHCLLKVLKYSPDEGVSIEHISLLLGPNFVMVFMEFENTVFEPLKQRLLNGNSRTMQKKADYLFYVLIDALLDTYYVIINELNNNIDDLEVKLLDKPEWNFINETYLIKKYLNELRPVLYPAGAALMALIKGDYPSISEKTITYMRDLKDHIDHVIQMYESSRDALTGLVELNSSNINNRLNNSMRILAVITTLFIPMSLITGIYGMNFLFIPELNWKYGYPLALLFIILAGSLMYFIIRRNKLL